MSRAPTWWDDLPTIESRQEFDRTRPTDIWGSPRGRRYGPPRRTTRGIRAMRRARSSGPSSKFVRRWRCITLFVQRCRLARGHDYSSPEAVNEFGVDTVGVQRPGHQVARAHPGPAGPIAERHPGARGAGCRGQHLDPLEGLLDATRTQRMCVRERAHQGLGDIAIDHGHTVLVAPCTSRHSDRGTPARSGCPRRTGRRRSSPERHRHMIDSPRRSGTPGGEPRIPVQCLQGRVDEDDPEAETEVHDRLGLGLDAGSEPRH